MIFGHLLTNTAQIFADVRTYWSPKQSRGYRQGTTGLAANGIIHLINSGACTWTPQASRRQTASLQ